MLLRILILAPICLALVACGDPLAARYQRQLSINNAIFGEDGRISTRIEAGRIASVGEVENEFIVDMRSAVPSPRVVVDNGTLRQPSIVVLVANALPGPITRVRREPLPLTARRDPRCADRDDGFTLELAPLEPPRLEDRLVFRVAPEPCSRLVLTLAPPPETSALRIAVVGAPVGRRAWLDDALASAIEADADWVQVVGSPTASPSLASYRAFADAMNRSGLPWHVLPGRDDAGTSAAFQDVFGPTDALAQVGAYRWLMLDTSESRIIEEQRQIVVRAGASSRQGVAWMTILPFDPVGDEREGFARRSVAVRLLENLSVAGFAHAFGSPSAVGGSRRFGNVHLHGLGGARPRAEREIAIITLPAPGATDPLCDSDAACEDEQRCITGRCLRVCQNSEACDDGLGCFRGSVCTPRCDTETPCLAGACEDGVCDPARRLDVEFVAF